MSSSGQERPDFVFWFLELAALACVFQGIEGRFGNGEIRSGVRWLIAAAVIGGVGFTWQQILGLFRDVRRWRIVRVPRTPASTAQFGQQAPSAQDKVFPPSVFQPPKMADVELEEAVYGRHVAVDLSSLYSPDDSKYVEFCFICFNGARLPVSVRVDGKLLFQTWAIVPWVMQAPKESIPPRREFAIVVRMVLSAEMAVTITQTIESGARVEFGLDRLGIWLTSSDGATSKLDKPVAVQCFKGIQVGRTIALKATMGAIAATGTLSSQ